MNWSRKIRAAVNLTRCFVAGFRDGWAQPHNLSTSTNVEWLLGDAIYDHPESVVQFSDRWQEALDTGINWGQRIRSPRHHQR